MFIVNLVCRLPNKNTKGFSSLHEQNTTLRSYWSLCWLLARLNNNMPFWLVFFYPQLCDSSTDGTIYSYRATTLNGSRTVSFSEYAGKTVLFVNVASYWGLTFQYLGKYWHYKLYYFTFNSGVNLCVSLWQIMQIVLVFLFVRTECTTWGDEALWIHHSWLSLQSIWETRTRE